MVSDQATQSDIYHWCQLQQGSSAALEVLYDRYFSQLFRYGLQLITDRSLVQDVLQDFFFELYTHHHSLSEVQQVRSYLFVCFRRKLLRSRTSNLPVARLEEVVQPTTQSSEHSLIYSQLSEEKRKLLTRAVTKLSKRQKEAVFLRFYQELSYEEIAVVLELKEVKYARTLIYRSIQVLRQQMKQYQSKLTLYSCLPLPEFLRLLKF
ncbi:MAG: RNA polymerase sigma factor [Bacteroidota bacterium]